MLPWMVSCLAKLQISRLSLANVETPSSLLQTTVERGLSGRFQINISFERFALRTQTAGVFGLSPSPGL